MRGLTPDTELRLHLAKAQEFWRQDRLDEALAAMKLALVTGLPSSDWYDLQRTIEAEWGARRVGRRIWVEESLAVEIDTGRWPDDSRRILRGILRAFQEVSDALAVRWGRPTLVTLIPEEEWVEFMHARYGYYAGRTGLHKVCLPPSAIRASFLLGMAARHELAHAATHEIGGERVPRWLDEGIAVVMEGSDTRPGWHRGRPLSLVELSGGFESYDFDIGGAHSARCYAAAGNFLGRLAGSQGFPGIRRFLLQIGQGQSVDRAFRSVYGLPLRAAEQDWIAGGRGSQ